MNKAKIIKLSEAIEEEVTLEINGIEIVGFASACPYKIYLDNYYSINIYATFLFEENYLEIVKPEYKINRINDAFAYIISGMVCGDGNLNIGQNIIIQTQEFLRNSSYLFGKFVQMEVDRLDIEFL